MVGRWNLLGVALSMCEERLYEWLLRSPTFHAGVRRIHRTLHERKHGRDPNEPLRPGEATAEQPLRRRRRDGDGDGRGGGGETNPGFFKYFVDEMRNQLRGTPTEDIPPRFEGGTEDGARRPRRGQPRR